MLAVFALVVGGAVAGEPAGTLKVDPVELIRGNEVAGRPELAATHYRFRYLFANETNKAEFEEHPEQFEIQLGGACARMGALSGTGQTDLYAVHEGKIYIFASEACRHTFLDDPDRVLDRPEAVPTGSDAAKRAGRALLAKAVGAMGGAGPIDAISVYQEREESQSEWEGTTYEVIDLVTIQFPDKVRTDHVWGDDRYTMVVTADDAWREHPRETFSMHAQQRRVAEAQYLGRNLLAILKNRDNPALTAVHIGSDEIDDDGESTPVELVAVHYRGATSTLGIDPKSGRVLFQAYHGRGPGAMLGKVERIFSDFESAGGVLLPKRPEMRFDGEEMDDEDDAKRTVAVNVPLAPNFFRRPNP
jgi:YHS domain-containing protein